MSTPSWLAAAGMLYGLVAMVKVRSISKTNPRAVKHSDSVAIMAGRRSAFAVYQQLQKEAAEEHAVEERVRCVLRSCSSCCVVLGGNLSKSSSSGYIIDNRVYHL